MNISKSVTVWLIIGLIMIMGQILIGGITRLTDSGLSITEWNVIKGTIPPLNQTEWNQAFENYKNHAAKQYNSIHLTIDIESFKRIYFWEYFHRLWARVMGFVFIIPFFIFLFKKKIPHRLFYKLGIVILLASLSAIFGWIMVASGLNDDKRTWVNAYNLLIHLILASSLFSYLCYTILDYRYINHINTVKTKNYELIIFMVILYFIQLCLGALMAGMKAGLVFPYYSMIVNFDTMQFILNSNIMTGIDSLIDYEPNPYIKMIVQIMHRITAYGLLTLVIYNYFLNKLSPKILVFLILLSVQVVLGLLTVKYSIGSIPIVLGVLHQFWAFVTLAYLIYITFIYSKYK